MDDLDGNHDGMIWKWKQNGFQEEALPEMSDFSQ